MAPYRAEVVGSLLRPPVLRDARKRWASDGMSVWQHARSTQEGFGGGTDGPGPIDSVALKRIEDEAVDAAIALQEAAGLDVITDGEQRRVSYFDPLFDAVDGLSPLPGPPVVWHSEAEGGADIEMRFPLSVTGKLRRRRSLVLEEFSYARAKATKPLKATLPSPLALTIAYSPEHSVTAYPDPFAMFADGVDLIQYEVRELAAAGCAYVQYDAAELSALLEPRTRKNFLADRHIEPDRLLDEAFEYLNAVAVQPGVTFGLHICRGSLPTHYMGEGGYDAIAKQILHRATRFDVFLLEYDDWRSGGFEVLAELPKDRTIVLGLVSAKDPTLESADELVARIEQAARYYPLENLALSSQCGFGSMLDFDTDPGVQERKLRLVAEVARRVWG